MNILFKEVKNLVNEYVQFFKLYWWLLLGIGICNGIFHNLTKQPPSNTEKMTTVQTSVANDKMDSKIRQR